MGPPQAPVPEGALLAARYSLERELGRGSFGIVWLARDRQVHNKAVVVKFLQVRTSSADVDWIHWIQRKFDEEIQALSTIRHPGIVGISDAGKTETGVPYLVMDYIDGVTIRSLLEGGQLDFKRAAELLKQIGAALAAAHENGVIHRDVKPENVMVQNLVTGQEHVCLIDFGIASVKRAMPQARSGAGTAETVVAGTMRYMAPEQFRGRPVSASDVYALGVIAYEMLTRRMPFEAASPFEIYEMQKREAFIDPKVLRPEMPQSVRHAILQALKFAEKDRPTAQEFCEALARSSDNSSALPLNPVEQERALDVAMARQIPVYEPAEVMAIVRRIRSAGLKAILEIDAETSLTNEHVRTRSLTLEFPLDQTGNPMALDLVLKIAAPDFEPKSQTKTIRVPPFADSSPCSFLLTPREVGELCVNIELYLGDVSVVSRVLKTHATTSERVPADVARALVSIPLFVLVQPRSLLDRIVNEGLLVSVDSIRNFVKDVEIGSPKVERPPALPVPPNRTDSPAATQMFHATQGTLPRATDSESNFTSVLAAGPVGIAPARQTSIPHQMPAAAQPVKGRDTAKVVAIAIVLSVLFLLAVILTLYLARSL